MQRKLKKSQRNNLDYQMKKVMLLEDDPTMLELLKTLLQIEGFKVKTILNIDHIIAEIQDYMPEIILMDVHLDDGKNGNHILASIKEEESLSVIKIIMTSGSDLRKECIANGADDFLFKPYMPDELIGKIENLIAT